MTSAAFADWLNLPLHSAAMTKKLAFGVANLFFDHCVSLCAIFYARLFEDSMQKIFASISQLQSLRGLSKTHDGLAACTIGLSDIIEY